MHYSVHKISNTNTNTNTNTGKLCVNGSVVGGTVVVSRDKQDAGVRHLWSVLCVPFAVDSTIAGV